MHDNPHAKADLVASRLSNGCTVARPDVPIEADGTRLARRMDLPAPREGSADILAALGLAAEKRSAATGRSDQG